MILQLLILAFYVGLFLSVKGVTICLRPRQSLVYCKCLITPRHGYSLSKISQRLPKKLSSMRNGVSMLLSSSTVLIMDLLARKSIKHGENCYAVSDSRIRQQQSELKKMLDMNMALPGSDLRRLETTSIPVPDRDDTYIAGMSVFHELHCLVRLPLFASSKC